MHWQVGSEERKRRAHARKTKIIGVLMGIMVVFTLAWTPLLILSLLMVQTDLTEVGTRVHDSPLEVYRVWVPGLRGFVWCLMGASGGVALTPFLYMFNDAFRHQLCRSALLFLSSAIDCEHSSC